MLFTPKGASSGITLYQQDFAAKDAKVYHDGDEFTQSVAWLIPSFAPLGKYDVKINVHGADRKADNHACLNAIFTI